MEAMVWASDSVWQTLRDHPGAGRVSWRQIDSSEQLLEVVEGGFSGAVVLDISEVAEDGESLVSTLRACCGGCGIYVVLSQPFVDRAADLMRAGATDVTSLPLEEEMIERIVESAEPGRPLPDPDTLDVDTLVAEARRAVEQDHLKRAHNLVRQILAADAANADAFNVLGVITEKRHEPIVAQKFYRVALDLDSTHRAAQTNLDRTTTHSDHRPPALGGSGQDDDGESDER